MKKSLVKAKIVLGKAVAAVEQRRDTYGAPDDFFQRLAKRWSLTLGKEVTPAQVILCMIDLKQERLCKDPSHLDSMIDVAGYVACLAENELD